MNNGEVLSKSAVDSLGELDCQYYCADSIKNTAGQGGCPYTRGNLRRASSIGQERELAYRKGTAPEDRGREWTESAASIAHV